MNAVLEMNPADAAGFISYLQEKRNEELIFMRWIPYQDIIGFKEFKNSLRPAVVRSEEEILDEVYTAYEKAANG